MRTSTLLGAALVAGSASPALAEPAPSPARVDRVAATLRGIETVPDEDALRRAFGTDLAPALQMLAGDTARPIHVRARAIARLGEVDPLRCEPTARGLLAAEETPAILQREAAKSWTTARPEAFSSWRHLAAHEVAWVREQAAIALGRLAEKHPELSSALHEMSERDPSRAVRRAADRALGARR